MTMQPRAKQHEGFRHAHPALEPQDRLSAAKPVADWVSWRRWPAANSGRYRQVTARSDVNTWPLVSGLSSNETRTLTSPTLVPISMGMANPS